MNTQQKNVLPWSLIITLGLIALIRPIIKIAGDVFGYTVSPLATVLISVGIAVVWIGVVVMLKVRKPVIVLALSGVAYAVLSIVMALAIQLLAPDLGDSEVAIATLLTSGLIATTIFNAAYGAFLGCVAYGVQKIVARR